MTRILSEASGAVSFIDPDGDGNLRRILLHAHDKFNVYRTHFAASGVSRQDIANGDVQSAFARLLPIDKRIYAELELDSLTAHGLTSFVIDASSGTTDSPVLKFTSAADDDAEAAAVTAAFEMIGVLSTDRCACVDIGASQIYLFYMRVLQQLGLTQSTFIKITSDHARSVELLRAYDPDIIISIPSVLKRCLASLTEAFRDGGIKRRRIVYIGEPMEASLRHHLASALRAECFSFYGTTEVGSVCIECTTHSGMHIPLNLFVPTLLPWPVDGPVRSIASERYRGAIAWTSLRIHGQPVIKYAVNDLCDIDIHQCHCGRTSPRLVFHRRVDETFFLYGITFTYQFFMDIIAAVVDRPVCLDIKVFRAGQGGERSVDSIVLTVDDSLRGAATDIYDALVNVHPISELVWGKLACVVLEFAPANRFNNRKTRRVRVIDL